MIIPGLPVRGNTRGGTDRRTPSCGGQRGSPDDHWQVTSREGGAFRVHVDSQYVAILAVYDDQGVEIACAGGDPRIQNSRIPNQLMVSLDARRTYTIVVDGFRADSGAYTLTVTPGIVPSEFPFTGCAATAMGCPPYPWE